MKIRILLFISTVFVGLSVAQAEPFIEPFIGISKFEYDVTFTNSTIDDERIANGYFLGGRGGWVFGKKYFIGGEYFHGGPYSFAFDSTTAKSKVTNSLIGGVIGADYKVVRISLSYYPTDKLHTTDQFGTVDQKAKYAVRLGIGLPISKERFRANLEVIVHFFDKDSFSSFSSISKYSVQTAGVSLSFPFELAR